ncbi:hypothetical protein GGR50DRAFT_657443, partial [Xylaria sp. CBS 124048]
MKRGFINDVFDACFFPFFFFFFFLILLFLTCILMPREMHIGILHEKAQKWSWGNDGYLFFFFFFTKAGFSR